MKEHADKAKGLAGNSEAILDILLICGICTSFSIRV